MRDLGVARKSIKLFGIQGAILKKLVKKRRVRPELFDRLGFFMTFLELGSLVELGLDVLLTLELLALFHCLVLIPRMENRACVVLRLPFLYLAEESCALEKLGIR